MRKFKKQFRVGLSLALAAVMLSNTALAEASDFTAGSLTELVKIVRSQGLARNTGFSVEYTGDESDLDYVMDDYSSFFYYDLAVYDDASTSDDADYIVGNINFAVDNWLTCEGNELGFNYKYFETTAETKYVNEKTPEILKDLNVASMSNYDKVKTIHDYVCNLIEYVDDADNYSSAYKAYSEGKGLCNSYALCMYKLLVNAGVPCKWVGGTAGTGRDAGGHAWNMVALGDQWYYLDATWDDDDSNNEILYDYFLKGTSDFDEADPSEVHTIDPYYTKTNYHNEFPLASNSFDPDNDSDVNNTITIGSNIGGGSSSPEPSNTEDPYYDDPENTDDPYYDPDYTDDPYYDPDYTDDPYYDPDYTDDPYYDPDYTDNPYDDDPYPYYDPTNSSAPVNTQDPYVAPTNTPTTNSPSAAPTQTNAPATTAAPVNTVQNTSVSNNTEYELDDIISGMYPKSGKFKLKINRIYDLQLFIDDETKANLIDSVDCNVISGKKRVKIVKNYGLISDKAGYFTDVRVRGRKKGNVKIEITLNLTNGQSLSYTFKGKIKKK